MAIRKLNDRFRKTFIGGKVFLTRTVAELDDKIKADVINKVRFYDAFNESNDPHSEHDFGNFEHSGVKYFWKIDYYDLAMEMASPDPANPAVTRRLLTILEAQEY